MGDDEGFVDLFNSFQEPVSQSTPVINPPTLSGSPKRKTNQFADQGSTLKRSRMEMRDPESSDEEMSPLSQPLFKKKKIVRNESPPNLFLMLMVRIRMMMIKVFQRREIHAREQLVLAPTS